MDEPTRWAVTGPGDIAGSVAADMALLDEVELVAVGSRSVHRARAFAQRFGVPRAYGSYREVLGDPDVEVVHVTTPHPQHHAVALAAIEAGKAVLVEKAFTATPAGARELVAAARARGTFLMEAMWTRFLPAHVRLRELLAAGAIGEPLHLQADLGIDVPFDPGHRLFAPGTAGGALLDLGPYLVALAHEVLGPPRAVHATGTTDPNGIESSVALLLEHDGGRGATLAAALHSPMPGAARVFGTEGVLELPPRFHHPDALVLHRPGREPERFDLPRTGTGYVGELLEVHRRVRAGEAESPTMPLATTLDVLDALAGAAAQLGIAWAEDPDALV